MSETFWQDTIDGSTAVDGSLPDERGSKYVGLALEFISQFPHGSIVPIKSVDDFFIDRGLMANPGTRSPENPIWSKHTHDRRGWVSKLNNGASSPVMPLDHTFSLDVLEAGERYIVRTTEDSFTTRVLAVPGQNVSLLNTQMKHLKQLLGGTNTAELPPYTKMRLEMLELEANDWVADAEYSAKKILRHFSRVMEMTKAKEGLPAPENDGE